MALNGHLTVNTVIDYYIGLAVNRSTQVLTNLGATLKFWVSG